MPKKFLTATNSAIIVLTFVVLALPASIYLVTKTVNTRNYAAPAVINAKDYTSIQAALGTVKETGGTVYLPAGEYLINEKIRVFSNVTLYGDGIGKTIIKFASGKSDHMMGNDSTRGQSNIMIRDLSLQGPGADSRTSNCCYGLKLENLTNAYVINVESSGFGFDGIYLGYKIKSGKALGVHNVRVTGCSVHDNGRNGIALTQGENNIIDHCTVQNNSLNEAVAGIDLEPDEGNVVSNNKIVSNTVTNNKNNGINLFSVDKSGNVLSDNSVCNNSTGGNGGTGVADHNGTNNKYTGNEVTADTGSGNASGSDCEIPNSIPQFITEVAAAFAATNQATSEAGSATPTPTTVVTNDGAGNKGDLDNNGTINETDVSFFINDYGKKGLSRADLNEDGVVDLFDYSVLVRYYQLFIKDPTTQ